LVENDVIKYLISKFEEKIHENPLSPDFVKLANYYLINNNINEAIVILKQGLEIYQEYTTAKIILGKCYLANRYFFDAKKIFENILIDFPEMSVAKKYLEITNDLMKSEVSRKHEQDIIPKLDFKTFEFNESGYNYNLFPNYDLEDLADDEQQFNPDENLPDFIEFKEVFHSPHFFKADKSIQGYDKKRLRNKFEVKVITETLADIFASQGNYFDAIEAYTYLLKIKPDKTSQLEGKIAEIEMKIQSLINDF
jgi:tetratricopeptide (TPR) repeat protein